MLTHMTLNVISPVAAEMNKAQANFVRHSVDIYKNFIRKFLPSAKIYHHTPEAKENLSNGCILEIASPDCRQGALAFFSPSCGKTEVKVSPKGINTGLNYKVTFDNSGTNFNICGYELLTGGLQISVPSALSSELILFEAI